MLSPAMRRWRVFRSNCSWCCTTALYTAIFFHMPTSSPSPIVLYTSVAYISHCGLPWLRQLCLWITMVTPTLFVDHHGYVNFVCGSPWLRQFHFVNYDVYTYTTGVCRSPKSKKCVDDIRYHQYTYCLVHHSYGKHVDQ
jgi:hypothetical protein